MAWYLWLALALAAWCLVSALAGLALGRVLSLAAVPVPTLSRVDVGRKAA